MTPEQAFLRACRLDVAVRKPGNVSFASPGHRMTAEQFIASAQAAAGPMFARGVPVGERIEGAIAATQAAVGCNTNLGIVLLAAPLAAAAEQPGARASRTALQQALAGVLHSLGIADADAAFRAIVQASPAGLGDSDQADVRQAARITLLEAMRLAAGRDRIASQYVLDFGEVFALAPPRQTLMEDPVDGVVQQVYLLFLATEPDSHIVRKHGEALAQTVMAAAQRWAVHGQPGGDPRFAAWDEELKAAGLNPGTSADLTVAALFAALLAP